MKDSNKNILAVVVFLVLAFISSLPGCSSISSGDTAETAQEKINQKEQSEEIEEKSQEKTPEKEDQKKDTEILAEFKDIIDKQGSTPRTIKEYVDGNIDHASKDTAGYMIKALEDIQRQYIDIYTDKLFAEDIQKKLLEIGLKDIDITDIDKIGQWQGHGLIEEMLYGGYKLIQLEGSYYPIIDYSLLAKYNDHLSARLRDYLAIMAAESDDSYLKDAAVVISWQELSNRLLRAETFLKDHTKQDNLTIEISGKYLDYLDSYIYGKDNTPTYDFTTKKIKEGVLESFNETVSSNKDTMTSDVISKVIELLEKSDLVFTDEIFEARKDLLKMPIKQYSLDSEYILSSKAGDLYYESNYSDLGYIKLNDGIYTEQYDIETEAELNIAMSDHLAVGDLNRDDINDVALILVSSPGGSGTFFDLHFVLNDYSYIYDYSTVFLGDRIQPENLSIEANKVFLNMVVHDDKDPLCCPTKDVLRTYVIFEGQVEELLSHIGALQEYGEDHISVLVDGQVIDIMLRDYQIGFELEPGDLVYVEYIADFTDETGILYYIEPASR